MTYPIIGSREESRLHYNERLDDWMRRESVNYARGHRERGSWRKNKRGDNTILKEFIECTKIRKRREKKFSSDEATGKGGNPVLL